MDDVHRSELVNRWISRHTSEFAWTKDLVLERHDLFPEADEELSALAVDDPDLCFDILLEIARANGSEKVLGPLGAKLSVLLEIEPTRFRDRLEASVPHDRVLRELLTWTLPDDPNREPWRRIKELVSEVPW